MVRPGSAQREIAREQPGHGKRASSVQPGIGAVHEGNLDVVGTLCLMMYARAQHSVTGFRRSSAFVDFLFSLFVGSYDSFLLRIGTVHSGEL